MDMCNIPSGESGEVLWAGGQKSCVFPVCLPDSPDLHCPTALIYLAWLVVCLVKCVSQTNKQAAGALCDGG